MSPRGTASVPGWYIEFQSAVLQQLPRDIDRETALYWVRNQEALKNTLESLVSPVRHTKQMFLVRLGYAGSLETKVSTGFAYVDPNITDANFKQVVGYGLEGLIELGAVVVNFGEFVTSKEAVSRLRLIGLRAGVPKELVDLSNGYPNPEAPLVNHLPIVTLGDSWYDPRGNRQVVCLSPNTSDDTGRRDLKLVPWDRGFNGVWGFLAFRDPPREVLSFPE